MDVDPLHDLLGSTEPFGQALEARDFGLTFVGDAWLEEHSRQMGSD
jgi:hypothetical protein